MSDNLDTIDIIVDDMLNDGHTGPADSLEWVQAKMKFYAERIKEAWKRQMSQSWHHREMEELVARHEKEVAELKARLPEPDPNWAEICAKCQDGEIEPKECEYYGEPNGCNSPIYQEHPKLASSRCAAALRDALSDACYAMFNFLKTQNGGYEEMAMALDKGKAALAVVPQQPSGKDEINAAVMRKALEKVYRIASTAKNDFDVFAGIERIWRISEWALAATPRNCDAFSKAEVLKVLEDRSFSKEDTIEWLYSIAAERKEENNGSLNGKE